MQPFQRHFAPKLLAQARQLEAMTFTLRQYLPPALAQHCWVAPPREQTLILLTDGAVWASQLRYQQQEVLKLLNSEFRLDLRRIRIRIVAPRGLAEAAHPVRRLPASGARALEAAASATEDPDLRAALQRLARRARPTPE